MMNTPKLPRPNTGNRAVIDQLMQRPLTYTEAVNIYLMTRRNLSGRYPSRDHVGYTITRLLKKYGYKDGKPGSKAPWKFRPQQVEMPAIVPLPDVDEDFGDTEHVTDFLNDRFDLSDSFPVNSLVVYTGPLTQDHGTLGRVVGTVDGRPDLRQVMWVTTEEAETIPVSQLQLRKEMISRVEKAPTAPGPSIPGLDIGDHVIYTGSEYGTRGKRGKVVGIYRNRRQVQWEGNLGQSSEDPSDLKPAPAEPPLPPGQWVSCKKDHLTFPAKVLLGPLSSGLYKVVCPNGTFEWLGRDQMTPTEEKDVYQATPEKPKYEGEARESSRTKRIREALEQSIEKDKLAHWAQLVLRDLSDAQKQALYDALDFEDYQPSSDDDEDVDF